jgi:starvation-inducible DNA-binding protein
MEAHIGISADNRKQVAQLLNTLLADQFLLYVKMLNFHWNVKSHHFNDLHAFFKSLYEAQFQDCDDIAERIRSLDAPSCGSMQELLKLTRLKESSGGLSDQAMIKQLLEDLEAIIRIVRIDAITCTEKYADLGTNNFLLNLLEKQEKTAWMLRASLMS